MYAKPRHQRGVQRRAVLALRTIGYEGASLAEFVRTLQSAGVTLLLDVRELPLSRRRGFSKTPLAATLAAAGIEYRHERVLGVPRVLRRQLQVDGDLTRYFAEFTKYLESEHTRLDELAHSLDGCVALMCLERHPEACHRSIVAAALQRRVKTELVHLSVDHSAAS
jgi:uncharacterized protein (DUF488 family)